MDLWALCTGCIQQSSHHAPLCGAKLKGPFGAVQGLVRHAQFGRQGFQARGHGGVAEEGFAQHAFHMIWIMSRAVPWVDTQPHSVRNSSSRTNSKWNDMSNRLQIEIENLKCGGCERAMGYPEKGSVSGLTAGLVNAKSFVSCAIGRMG